MRTTPFAAACLICAGLAATASPVAGALEPAPDVPTLEETITNLTRAEMPDTNSCPQATVPPEPKTTSEAVAPGSTTPTPLEVTYQGPCGVTLPEGFNVGDMVLASAWLIADLDSGQVVAMKDPHGRYRPASIIKVLLALVSIDELPLDKKVTASEESAAMEGSAAGIGAAGEYTVNDLLHGLLMASGNDTAHALAQELGGDAEALRKVNDLAQHLGMHDTRVETYTGLDKAGMSTSAWDMGLAYRAAFANPTFANIVDTESYPFPGFGDQPGFELWNDNHLYLNDPEGIGGKTGYTDDANHTFVGAVNHDGRRLAAVLLDTTVDKARAWEQAQAMLHEAYRFPGAGVATLEAASADHPAEQAQELPSAPEPPAVRAADSDRGTFPWASAGIVAAVLALAAGGVWVSRASAATGRPRRRRPGRRPRQ